MTVLLSIPIASYYSIERLALIYFSYAQQDQKLNETGIAKYSALLGTSDFSVASSLALLLMGDHYHANGFKGQLRLIDIQR